MSKEDLRTQLDDALKQAVAAGLSADEIGAELERAADRMEKLRVLEES